ncbi:MAG: polysaccharide pyruvyl transferase family protein [Clostridia bacterium]|nr:polysaccharide pyruvyl transferase family protein [Clostridia bacterium]
MSNVVLYGHGSSLNHGCEAIVKTTEAMVRRAVQDADVYLSTLDADNDRKAFPFIDHFIENRSVPNNLFFNVALYFGAKFFPSRDLGNAYRYKEFYRRIKTFSPDTLWISVGGDNYCAAAPRWLYRQNEAIDRSGARRILWGASVEPETTGSEMMADLNGYQAIFVRESITRDSLIEKGYTGNLLYHADPAFTLPVSTVRVPDSMKSGDWIGVNLSPVVMRSETVGGVTYQNYRSLLEYIIKETSYNVALIPHVVLPENSDYQAMSQLYAEFKDTGRILQIPDTYTASEYKGIISSCKLFVGARTHATIAAYSTCVPTLVIGYSVKAKGIAKDLFGSYTGYVLPVQELDEVDRLTGAFVNAMDRAESDRQRLQAVIPGFVESSLSAADDLKKEYER